MFDGSYEVHLTAHGYPDAVGAATVVNGYLSGGSTAFLLNSQLSSSLAARLQGTMNVEIFEGAVSMGTGRRFSLPMSGVFTATGFELLGIGPRGLIVNVSCDRFA